LPKAIQKPRFAGDSYGEQRFAKKLAEVESGQELPNLITIKALQTYA